MAVVTLFPAHHSSHLAPVAVGMGVGAPWLRRRFIIVIHHNVYGKQSGVLPFAGMRPNLKAKSMPFRCFLKSYVISIY
jgi:hypothetical protein